MITSGIDVPSEPHSTAVRPDVAEEPRELDIGENWCTTPGRPGVLVARCFEPENAAGEACMYWSQCRPVFAELDVAEWQGIEVTVRTSRGAVYMVEVSAEVKVEWQASRAAEVHAGAERP